MLNLFSFDDYFHQLLKGLVNIVYGQENKSFEKIIVIMDKDKYYLKLRNYYYKNEIVG